MVKTATQNDRDLRKRIHASLNGQTYTSHCYLNGIVDDDIFKLWGQVETETEREALILADHKISGVK